MRKTFFRNILSNRPLQHLLFWMASYYVLLRIFSTSGEIGKIDLIYTLVFIATLLPGIYLNLLYLIPRFLSRKRYFSYGILLVAFILLTSELNDVTFTYLVDHILPGYYFISYYSFFDLLKFVVVFTGITTLLKLSRGWFVLAETRNRLVQLEKENAETRLEALKSQVNPHFLFNSLASLYSLVLKQSPVAPDVILRLSDFLRYVLYDVNADFVDLSKELSAMKDYVELQKLRAGKLARIDIETKGSFGDKTVAPLLFLPLIENCFKHGIKGTTGDSFTKIRFEISGSDTLTAWFENNKESSREDRSSGSKGLGLVNLRHRLELIYPGQHEFVITVGANRFSVMLKIPLYEKTAMHRH